MRRLTRGTIREARNVLTLTRARASGGGGTTVSIPQPTAQNQIIISNATPAWSLLAAPTAQGQVLVTGADPYTPVWGTTFPAVIQFNAGITFGGATGVNVITVPDNLVQAMHIVDSGGTEFLRIRTDGTPTMVFNEGGVEIDVRFEAIGEPNAIFLDGATGQIGYGTTSPAGIVHLYRTTNTQHRLVIDAQGSSDGQTAVIDLVTKGDGTKTVGDAATLGWHITARGDAYAGAVQQNDLFFTYWDGSTYEYILRLDHAGAVSITENSATVRLSGTVPIQFGIGEPIVETFGQWRIPWACTVTRVDGNVIGGTSCTVNLEERSAVGSSGTNVLSSDMVADVNGESVTSGFNDSALAAGNYLAIDVSAVSGNVDCLSITLTVTID